MGIVGSRLYPDAVTKQLPSLMPEKILMALHDAGWNYGIIRAHFAHIGRLYVVDATKHDGRHYVAHAEPELGALVELWDMVTAVDKKQEAHGNLRENCHAS